MTEQPNPPDIDFEEIYRDGTNAALIPWDIGEPQPALAELVSAGWCAGTILDIGCGTGELGLALAARGHAVTGVDLAPSVIELARRKASERKLTEQWLCELLSEGWQIDALEAADILGVVPDGLGEMSEWPKDESGRTPMTGWRLRGHRFAA